MRFKLAITLALLLLIYAVFFKYLENTYTKETELEYKKMKSPVILINKTKMTFWYNVDLLDGNNKYYHFGSMSKLASQIADSSIVGDTLK